MSDEKSVTDPVEPLAKRITSIRVLLAAAVALLSAGAGCALYLSRYALVTDLEAGMTSTRRRIGLVEDRAGSLETKTAVLEAMQRTIESELHWQRDQAIETARRVGARVVPEPAEHRIERNSR